MIPMSPSDTATPFHIQLFACFVNYGPEGIQEDKNKLEGLVTNLCDKVQQSNFRQVIADLNGVKEHIKDLKGRIKKFDKDLSFSHANNFLDSVLPHFIHLFLGGLRKAYPDSDHLIERTSHLKSLMNEARKQRKADQNFGRFPVLPDDLYSKIWNLITPEEQKRIFPQPGARLDRVVVPRQATVISESSPQSASTSYLQALQSRKSAYALKSEHENPWDV